MADADLEFAMNKIDSYVDISKDDLAKIYKLAFKHAQRISGQPGQVSVGNHYSNGEYGEHWSVRRVTGTSGEGQNVLVTYDILDGDGLGTTATCTLADFNNWQRYEVIQDKGTWHRIMRNQFAEQRPDQIHHTTISASSSPASHVARHEHAASHPDSPRPDFSLCSAAAGHSMNRCRRCSQ